jgi:hypothetical protein
MGGYVLQVEANKGKTGRETLTGQALEDEGLKDALGKAERTGHRIRAKMRGNSYGPKNRSVEVTFDYQRGFINHHEEVFLLGTERGLVLRPTNTKYVVDGFPKKGEVMTFNGKDNFLKALETNSELSKHIIAQLRDRDIDLLEKGPNSVYFGAENARQQKDEESSED